jgi:hypothetical protein
LLKGKSYLYHKVSSDTSVEEQKNQPIFHDSRPKVAALVTLVLVSSVIVVSPFVLYALPTNNLIKISVDENGGFFQNFTISCYGCVADGQYVWQGILTVPSIKTPDGSPLSLNVSDPHSNSSLGLGLFFAVGITKGNNSACNSTFYTNTTCIYPTSFPFNMTFNFQKTSKGGLLHVILYLANGLGFSFQTTSGNLTKTVKYLGPQS